MQACFCCVSTVFVLQWCAWMLNTTEWIAQHFEGSFHLLFPDNLLRILQHLYQAKLVNLCCILCQAQLIKLNFVHDLMGHHSVWHLPVYNQSMAYVHHLRNQVSSNCQEAWGLNDPNYSHKTFYCKYWHNFLCQAKLLFQSHLWKQLTHCSCQQFQKFWGIS